MSIMETKKLIDVDLSKMKPNDYKELLDDVRNITTKKSKGAVIVLTQLHETAVSRGFTGQAVVNCLSKSEIISTIFKMLEVNMAEFCFLQLRSELHNKKDI